MNSGRWWCFRSERISSESSFSGQLAEIQVIADGRDSNTANTATGYIGAVVESFNARWRAEHGPDGPRIQIASRTWYNPNLETRWMMIPSLIGMLTMLQTMMVTALSVAREREEGTFDQLLVTPFRPMKSWRARHCRRCSSARSRRRRFSPWRNFGFAFHLPGPSSRSMWDSASSSSPPSASDCSSPQWRRICSRRCSSLLSPSFPLRFYPASRLQSPTCPPRFST